MEPWRPGHERLQDPLPPLDLTWCLYSLLGETGLPADPSAAPMSSSGSSARSALSGKLSPLCAHRPSSPQVFAQKPPLISPSLTTHQLFTTTPREPHTAPPFSRSPSRVVFSVASPITLCISLVSFLSLSSYLNTSQNDNFSVLRSLRTQYTSSQRMNEYQKGPQMESCPAQGKEGAD